MGHSNLSAPNFTAVRRVAGARIAVMVHDTMPLDHPEFAGPAVPEASAGRLRRADGAADLVI